MGTMSLAITFQPIGKSTKNLNSVPLMKSFFEKKTHEKGFFSMNTMV